LVPIILQNIFLCVQQKKETHTGLQQLEGEYCKCPLRAQPYSVNSSPNDL